MRGCDSCCEGMWKLQIEGVGLANGGYVESEGRDEYV